jgi:ribosomal protein S18 acetylase RimI-like enzyme
MPAPLEIRRLTRPDLPFAAGLSAAAGWNQTRDDWLRLLNCRTDGCFVAEWIGNPAGTVTTTSYGDTLAWIGMLLVEPALRGKGIGKALLQAALDSLMQRGIRCIKLDATPQGQPLYERLGFQPEWTFQRWETSGRTLPDVLPSFRTRRRRELDRAEIAALDYRAFGADRWIMLRRIEDDISRGLVNESPRGRINGFGYARKGAKAVYLGPIVAANQSAAAAIFKSLLHPLTNRRVFWDIPDHQTGTVELAHKLGFRPQRSLLRMWLGEHNVPGRPEWIHALAGPEIG